jgi:adenosylcobinamide-GDP ribazoletransferase
VTARSPGGLRLAVSLLTAIPAGRVPPPDRRQVRAAMAWAPVVGLMVAAVGAMVLLAARVAFTSPIHDLPGAGTSVETATLASALAIAATALVSGGLHLDGFADTVDGWASRAPRDRTLEIMADARLGSLGAAALILVLVIEIAALTLGVRAHHGTQSLVISVVSGRTPAARPTGLGAMAAGSVPKWTAVGWTAALVVAAAAFGRWDPEAGSSFAAVRAAGAVVTAVASGWVIRRWAVRRLGGVTGDVLGAISEVATVAALLILDVRHP